MKTKEAFIHEFFDNTGATYNQVVNYFTLGIDRLWKKHIAGKLTAPHKILDLACGTGILTALLAKRFPKSEIVAVDISPSYLEVAWRNLYKKDIKNVSFILCAAEDFKPDETFDAVTASYLPKYADLDLLIKNLSKMITPNGILVFHDFTYPSKPVLQYIFKSYFKFMQGVGGFLYPKWKPVFYQLPDLIRETEWVSELTAALTREGFVQIEVESLTLQGSACVSARKPNLT